MSRYDALIIGAGMSGLACGIRLAMFDKKVCILESHTIAGGLNSYYQRRSRVNKEIIKFDVGLHALTNFVKKGTKRAPLTKLLKQLRFQYNDLKLQEQSHSLIKFDNTQLKFTNDFEVLKLEVSEKFPSEIDGFIKLVNAVNEFNELDLSNSEYTSSRDVLKNFINDELLVEMLLCPLLIYGSAWEHDIDFSQFVIMFKSLYFEGFSRPEGGVRTIINLLETKFKELGGELKYRHGVQEILTKDDKVVGLRTKKGDFFSDVIFSSAGLPETMSLIEENKAKYEVGKMTFMESIAVLDRPIDPKDFDATIMFYNNGPKYHYEGAKDFFDPRSAVICVPDNYQGNNDPYGVVRITYMANYEKFNALSKEEYNQTKDLAFDKAMELVKSQFNNFDYNIILKDTFTPTTIKHYTRHFRGTVYGSPQKIKNGKTPYEGLYIIGTDQGFLGIVGSILSGISLGNLYGLMQE